jgi:hypothetical protein
VARAGREETRRREDEMGRAGFLMGGDGVGNNTDGGGERGDRVRV